MGIIDDQFELHSNGDSWGFQESPSYWKLTQVKRISRAPSDSPNRASRRKKPASAGEHAPDPIGASKLLYPHRDASFGAVMELAF
jgi:hypothetical protein